MAGDSRPVPALREQQRARCTEPLRWTRGLAALLIAAGITHGTSARADELAQPVDYAAVIAYERTLPAETLIRIAWAGTGQADRAVAIARRESGLRCDADNPHSSAAGLMQTMAIHKARAARLGLSWANIEGPDCLDDVMLAFDIWQDSGWRPWAL